MHEGPLTPPPSSLPALRLLERHSPHEIAEAIEIMIDFLDVLSGDPEAEPGSNEDDFVDHPADGPGCPIADPGDPAWIEWHSRGRFKLGQRDSEARMRLGGHGLPHEDDEDDDPDQCLAEDDNGTVAARRRVRMGFAGDDGHNDPEGDFCLAGDDRVTSGPVIDSSIYGFAYHAKRGHEIGDAEDAEGEGMRDDVPTLPVYSLVPDIFTGKREYLGHSNLMTSFRSNGDTLISADSGRKHRRRGSDAPTKPGTPV